MEYSIKPKRLGERRIIHYPQKRIIGLYVYSRVSSGSDSFYLYVEDGNGNVNYTTVSKSGTITINDFNGFDPSGKWKIWIVTKGTVSTSTETIKVYYTY